MNNKKLGTDFEKELCKRLAERGYWVHFIAPDERGAQPFDIIAVKDGVAHAIECKTLADTTKYFPITRLEENQILAFEKWLACGNCEPVVAVYWRKEIHAINYSELKEKGKVNMYEH